ncbi:DUF1684 domain-containing protein [Spirosoma utsteinense]|uniref:DUF1684 domain-containing protein n=1 Tax=Spirosoma utsteinense TaxID=2585773 RepID=A0ABR6W038_9BACT|nr:DUF1684 domain-containing protein [Spirosoma utsteinense]MBC3786560.1 hypothetical protein [Spirosoma utsteinense]MBC3789938.1 hypothetical protein [Spirosoma utsteinense]
MLKNRFLLGGLALLLVVVLYYAFFDNGTSADGLAAITDPRAYQQQMDTARSEKDRSLRTSADSPLPDKANFKGLVYFKPDLTYRVTARLEPFADKTQKLVVRMSDGSEEVYEKFAHVVFSLNGETCRLLVVKFDDTYSILFRDVTSGKETYGGGRYLELAPSDMIDNRAILDFNKAYNPYCAYNPSYACPLPPAENTLKTAVNAGERYVAHD